MANFLVHPTPLQSSPITYECPQNSRQSVSSLSLFLFLPLLHFFCPFPHSLSSLFLPFFSSSLLFIHDPFPLSLSSLSLTYFFSSATHPSFSSSLPPSLFLSLSLFDLFLAQVIIPFLLFLASKSVSF